MGENEKAANQLTQAAASEGEKPHTGAVAFTYIPAPASHAGVFVSPFQLVAEGDAMEIEARALLDKINRELDDVEEQAKRLLYAVG